MDNRHLADAAVSKDKIKVLLLANWGIGEKLLESLHFSLDVDIKLVITQPDDSGQDYWANCVCVAADKYGYEVKKASGLDFDGLRGLLIGLDIDLLVVHAYRKILPASVFEVPAFGSINIHSSLLPKYRGAAPSAEVLKNKEKQTGLTCHYIDAGIDTGDIISQITVNVDLKDTRDSLIDKMKEKVDVLMVDAISKVIERVEPIRQSNLMKVI